MDAAEYLKDPGNKDAIEIGLIMTEILIVPSILHVMVKDVVKMSFRITNRFCALYYFILRWWIHL